MLRIIRVIGSYGREQQPDEYTDRIKAKQEEIREWRGGEMGFVMGLLGRYVMFTAAFFVVGGVMGWFLIRGAMRKHRII